MTDGPTLSVVIASYNRPHLLARLLRQLAEQSLSPQQFEVVVVDDGSKPPVRDALEGLALPYPLRLCVQENAGAAAARDRGARSANGEVLVFLDDDMQVERGFLAAHQARHRDGRPRAVLGRIRPGSNPAAMPLFERWHAHQIARVGDAIERGRPARGNDLYSGNVSMRRADYFAVGGFDVSLGHSEDAELGLRLEQGGVALEFAPDACSLHESDHTSLERWLARARLYGVFDQRIARKHPDAWHANPWRFAFELHPLARPLVASSLLAPGVAEPVARALFSVASALDRAGMARLALAGTSASFGVEYFHGLREETGSLGVALREFLKYASTTESAPPNSARFALVQLRRFLMAVREDHRTLRHYEGRFGHLAPSQGNAAADAVQKIGFQILVAYRLMRLLRDSGLLLGAKVVSRMIRHLYGSDIHWDATIEPGVLFVHGMGLAIHGQARVAPGCILSQHVTLGVGIDPLTREVGAPRLEREVHVGPGAMLIGPIIVGEGSKIMAGVVLHRSVPPRSVVEAPTPAIRPRAARPTLPPPGSRNVADPSRPVQV